MEPEGSLPCSQVPATDPCPEPDASSTDLPTPFPQDTSIRNVILPSTPRSSEWPLYFQVFRPKRTRFLISPIRASCSVRVILLEFITL